MKHYDDIEADDCYDMAVEWARHGNSEKAVHCLERAIDLNGNFMYAYIALARIFAAQKKFSDAVHILKKATRIDPAFDRLHFLMAKYAYKNGDYKSAMICINKAIEIDDKELYLLAREIIEDIYHSR